MPAESNSRHHLPKGVVVIIAFLALLLLGLGIYFSFGRDQGQSIENEEPALEFAGENSRLAGIQALMDLGITYEQYKKIHNEVTKILDQADPDASYFEFVYDSLTLEEAITKQSELTAAEKADIVARIGAEDATAEVFGATSESEVDKNAHKTLTPLPLVSFKLKSNNGTEYTVKFDRSKLVSEMTVSAFNAEGEKL